MKVGLVLAGGGARGAYEIGVWKALRELNIEPYIEVISGTSIGALNSVLFIQGDLDKAQKLWYEIRKEKILPTDNKDLFTRGILVTIGSKNMNFVKKYIPKALESGNIDRIGLLEILDKYFDYNKIIENKIVCYATCTQIPDFTPKYFKVNIESEEKVRKILLATSALPMIYESERIDGKQYLDGSMVDNIPIQPVYGEGCELIIVVSLSKEVVINKSLYPNTRFIEIIPTTIDDGFVDGVLDFTPESAYKRIVQGYEDAIDSLKPIFDLYELVLKGKQLELDKCEANMKKGREKFFNMLRSKMRNRNQ